MHVTTLLDCWANLGFLQAMCQCIEDQVGIRGMVGYGGGCFEHDQYFFHVFFFGHAHHPPWEIGLLLQNV